MSLLLKERPVVLQPSLVRRLGILDAAIVQQLNFWAERATHSHDGETWVYKTYSDWADEIGVSAKAARGALSRLRTAGVVVSIENPLVGGDRTLWWRLDYEVLRDGEEDHLPSGADAPDHVPHGADRLPPRGGPSAPTGISTRGSDCRTESTTEMTPESARTRAEKDTAPVVFLCELLASSIVANDPKASPSPESRSWRTDARLLLEKDGRDFDEVQRVIHWCQADPFWRSNILSMPTLRDKYPQLRLKMNDQVPSAGHRNGQSTAADYLALLTPEGESA